MRRIIEEPTNRSVTTRYEASIDELLSDPVAEAIMRCDRITRTDVYRVIRQVIVQRAAARNKILKTAGSSTRGARVWSFCGANIDR